MRVLKSTLEEFGNMFGLWANLQKSNVFVAGASEDVVNEICGIMGMEISNMPVRYLGVPLIIGKLKYGDCITLKNKILSRIGN